MIVQAVIIGLATWRVTSLIVTERGPFAVFERFRYLVGIRPRTELSELARLFACPLCLSVWIAPAIWGLWYLAWWIPALLAVMAIAVIVEAYVRGRE